MHVPDYSDDNRWPGVRKGNNIPQEIKLIKDKTTPTRAKALILKKRRRVDTEMEKSSNKIRKVHDTRLGTKDKLNNGDKKNQTGNTTVTETPKAKVTTSNTTSNRTGDWHNMVEEVYQPNEEISRKNNNKSLPKIQTEQPENFMALPIESSGKTPEPESDISSSHDQSADVGSEQAQAASIDKRPGLLKQEADGSNEINHSEEESQVPIPRKWTSLFTTLRRGRATFSKHTPRGNIASRMTMH
ncbi:67_t:CDS:2 [Cetraspora pellucida]|uniref:67_t:CDS:1 n=1 Tax=Cetraspora pellucida TaxID=1433469 RepID=A0A9N9GV38_9GLOM|nr:67_t:CDS:2 [Cetraspora pellucida]